jgi:hypothetical protein
LRPRHRPFVVHGLARTARLADASDWLDAPTALDAAPSPAHATALAAAWRGDALAEHASVASFHRFGLELLGCGAPVALVADAAVAVLDEIRHAKACFTIATALDGSQVGPGPLAIADATLHRDLAALAAATVTEGCVGETLAAARAAAAARGCSDAGIAVTLRRIADDEARHADLAWKFVAWAVRQGDPAVREAVAMAFARGTARALDPRDVLLADVPDAVRCQHGQLAAGQGVGLDAAVLAQVVRPCAVALLGEAIGR